MRLEILKLGGKDHSSALSLANILNPKETENRKGGIGYMFNCLSLSVCIQWLFKKFNTMSEVQVSNTSPTSLGFLSLEDFRFFF